MDFNLFGPVFLMLPLWYSCLAAQHFSPSLISQETCGFLTIPPILCLRFLANNIQDICLALAPPSVMAAKLASLSDIFSKYHSGYLLWTICDESLPVCLRFLAKSIQDICLAYGSTICDGNLPVCLHACCHCLQDEGMYFMGCSLDQLKYRFVLLFIPCKSCFNGNLDNIMIKIMINNRPPCTLDKPISAKSLVT